MVSSLILKHIRNLSDESVVEQRFENIYYQYFSGERTYACGMPCEPSELVHFRNRIGARSVDLIFKESIRVNDKDGGEQEATTDTTVQEKNTTYPTDNKLHRRTIEKCIALARKEGIELRKSCRRTAKKLLLEQRFRNHPKNKGRAKKADRKIKTIAGRLVRDLERKLTPDSHQNTLSLFKKVLMQKKADNNKIYNLHEPHTQCMSKGREHSNVSAPNIHRQPFRPLQL